MGNYAGIIVRYQNQVLLCKRNAKSSLPGHWSCPAGSVEKGESYKAAALREFYEETSKRIDGDIEFVGVVKRYNRDGTRLKGKMHTFLYDAIEPIFPDLSAAISGHEHTKCRYFKKKNIPQPMTNEFRRLLKLILK